METFFPTEALKTLLEKGLESYGLPTECADRELFYLNRLLEQNQVMNLTAITDPAEAVRLHLLDCLALLKEYDFARKRVIDVGCGAGLPGMPLKLAVPSMNLTLLDATEKKIAFLERIGTELELTDVQYIAARAEERPDLRERFDVAVSRAVARLNILAELCLPFVRVGGIFCALKSRASDEEVTEAATAIRTLGGKILRETDYTIPDTDIIHRAVWIEKIRPTPAAYPRRYAKIKQRPL